MLQYAVIFNQRARTVDERLNTSMLLMHDA
jgi:hypothetical protein